MMKVASNSISCEADAFICELADFASYLSHAEESMSQSYDESIHSSSPTNSESRDFSHLNEPNSPIAQHLHLMVEVDNTTVMRHTSTEISLSEESLCVHSSETEIVETVLKQRNSNESSIESLNTISDHGESRSINAISQSVHNTSTSPDTLSSIKNSLTCSICLDIFLIPVTLQCGHSYCRYCIAFCQAMCKCCPLCRVPIDFRVNVNMALFNIVEKINPRDLRFSTLLLSNTEPITFVTREWWQKHFPKPSVSVSLFFKLFLHQALVSGILFTDIIACVIDYYSFNKCWSVTKWMFDINDCIKFQKIVGYDKSKEKTSWDQLKLWVTSYALQHPKIYVPRVSTLFRLKLCEDLKHKVQKQTFDNLLIQDQCPIDAGRHQHSSLHLTHSSISTCHFILLRCPNGLVGIVDLGSTIGTMIRVDQREVIRTNTQLFFGDKVGVDTKIFKVEEEDFYFVWLSFDEVLYVHEKTKIAYAICADRHSGIISKNASNIEIDTSWTKLKSVLAVFLSDIDEPIWVYPGGTSLCRGQPDERCSNMIVVPEKSTFQKYCNLMLDQETNYWTVEPEPRKTDLYIKINAFDDPLPLNHFSLFKAGQCKIQIAYGST